MRRLLLAAPLFLLAACAGEDKLSKLQPPGYLRDAPDLVAQADWSGPEEVRVQLTNYDFTPDELVFHRGRPTRLVLVNPSSKTHTFASSDFLQTIAVKQLSGPEGTVEAPWVEHVVVPPGQTKELWFIPAKYGAYHFNCDVTGHSEFGMRGLISVQ